MSKKILLLSSVIFLSSCATTNISELGDKFLDLINPSDDATEVAMLSGEETLIAMDEAGGFTIDELEELSNDELIAIAREKGLEDLILLDEDGNLLNRDQIINAIVESAALLESKSEELESMSDDELIEVAVAKGLTEQIVLDADGNLANREELVEALLESAAATEAAISEFGNNADSFTLYFAYDDTEIDEVATRASSPLNVATSVASSEGFIRSRNLSPSSDMLVVAHELRKITLDSNRIFFDILDFLN